MEESQLFGAFERIRNMSSAEKVNIIIGDCSYLVNKSYAAALSPFFYETLQNNPSLNKLTLNNIKDTNKDFQKFLNNDKIDFMYSSIDELLEEARQLVTDPSYRMQRGACAKEFIINPQQFRRLFDDLIDNHSFEKEFSYDNQQDLSFPKTP